MLLVTFFTKVAPLLVQLKINKFELLYEVGTWRGGRMATANKRNRVLKGHVFFFHEIMANQRDRVRNATCAMDKHYPAGM
mmetsp:Transcript_69333/g.112547  ORF Transcript_69333/g.112547 Transcript_69333/m.112547 type:complete len:80 (-) Transcript_69333:179-418(-)